jgi:hypothetical protein
MCFRWNKVWGLWGGIGRGCGVGISGRLDTVYGC